MATRTLFVLVCCAASFVVSCGGKTAADQGTSGSSGAGGTSGTSGTAGTAGTSGTAGGGGTAGTAGTAGTSGTGGAPDGCLLDSPQPGPHSVTFLLQNPSPVPITLWQDCDYGQNITSCESSYTEALAIAADCTISCSEPPGGCIACGACLSQPITLAPNEQKEVTWDGNTYTFSQLDGCNCHNTFAAPAAHYRFSIPIYPMVDPSDPFAPKPDPIKTVSQDFVLPAPGGVVSVNLAQ